MARAVIAFERVGWTIIPYPVDYQTGTLIDFKQFSPTIGIKLWNRWIYETLGMAAYRLRFAFA
jgi:hypothetical protein